MEGLTIQKLKNKKFRNSEEAILNAILATNGDLNIKRIIRVADISRATFYRHHGASRNIVPNYEKYILHKYKNTLRYLARNKTTGMKVVYECLLFFMLNNQKAMKLFLVTKAPMTEKLIFVLESRIINTKKVQTGEMFEIYASEIAAIIEKWERDGFKEAGIGPTVAKIMFLTSTAHVRLGPLANIN